MPTVTTPTKNNQGTDAFGPYDAPAGDGAITIQPTTDGDWLTAGRTVDYLIEKLVAGSWRQAVQGTMDTGLNAKGNVPSVTVYRSADATQLRATLTYSAAVRCGWVITY